MARSNSTSPIPKAAPAGANPAAQPKRPEGARDTVEAIVGAVLLAVLFRGFVAEAFVIPTGSMAPTLMGRHKEIACPQCGHVYAVNAAGEVEGDELRSASRSDLRVASGICENCRFQADLSREPSFKGDRILVMKFPYDLPGLPGAGPPGRWDVVVFRYPEEPEVSYIKRLVGLAGETLKVWHGDIFIRAPGASGFRIARKPLLHQRAMQQAVYDDRERPLALRDQPAWSRWAPVRAESWAEESSRPGTYRHAPSPGGGWDELRYRHLVPDPGQWLSLVAGEPLPRGPRPTLITDFSSYNTNLSAAHSDLTGGLRVEQEGAWFQPHWVGDLTLSARVATPAGPAPLRLELVEGGVVNRCEIDAAGTVTLSRNGTTLGTRANAVPAGAAHTWEFANVDNRLTVSVDGVAPFGEGLTYDDDPASHPEPTAEDLSPVRIATRGGEVVVSDLVLKRDIYYTLKPGVSDYGNTWDGRLPRNPTALADLLADPSRVAALGPLKSAEYPIGEGRFMMLGDNSPRSRDGRDWRETDRDWDPSGRQSWEVPRALITGKAFCVYWPHGKPFGPDIRLGTDFRIPFRPYFERMKWIR